MKPSSECRQPRSQELPTPFGLDGPPKLEYIKVMFRGPGILPYAETKLGSLQALPELYADAGSSILRVLQLLLRFSLFVTILILQVLRNAIHSEDEMLHP